MIFAGTANQNDRAEAANLVETLAGSERRCEGTQHRLWQGLLFHVYPVLAIASVLTFLVIQNSIRFGRLSAPSAYDDVAYIVDGLERLTIAKQAGVSVLIQNLVSSPPHSPWSTLAALCGFATFGYHDWAPYVLNIACPILILAMANFISRNLPIWQRFLVLSYVASMPVVLLSVSEFRPDFLSAMLIACGSTLIVITPVDGKAKTSIVFAGLLFAIALVTKPTCFPFTLLILMLTLSLWVTRGLLRGSSTFSRKYIASTLGLFLVPPILVAGPYYFKAWKGTVDYIIGNNFSAQAKIWVNDFAPSLLEKLRFYLDGMSAQWAFQSQVYPLICLILIGFCISLSLRNSSDAKWQSLTLAFLTTVSYFIITVNPVNGVFYGLPIFSFALCLAVFFIVGALSWANQKGPIVATTVSLICLALISQSWCTFRHPKFNAISTDWQVLKFLDDAISKYAPGKNPKVLFTSTGNVGYQLLNYSRLKQGRSDIFIVSPKLFASLETIISQTAEYDLVLAADESTPNLATNVPFVQKQDEIIRHLKANEDWQEVSFLRYDNGGYHVFAHIPREKIGPKSPQVNVPQGIRNE